MICYNKIQKLIEKVLINEKLIIKNDNNEFEIGNMMNDLILDNDILSKNNEIQNNICIIEDEKIIENGNKIYNSINLMNDSISSIINNEKQINNRYKIISNQENI